MQLNFVGFGEAGRAFAPVIGGSIPVRPSAFDIKTDQAETREEMSRAYKQHGISGCASLPEGLSGADLVLSLVTADQAAVVARDSAGKLQSGALFCDMNSVSPQTKQASAKLIDSKGGAYVDVAIMAPVDPLRQDVPLLVSGPHAATAIDALKECGFTDVSSAGVEIGQAATTKMLRSVIVKGMEALAAEAVLAAEKAGVAEAVLASLGADWEDRADYALDRMMIHGGRRSAEMREVEGTLSSLGAQSAMTQGTIAWQSEVGGLGLVPLDGLKNKLKQLEA